MLRHIFIILRKDLLIDLRRKENMLAMVFFSLMLLLIFQFILGNQPAHYQLTPLALATLREAGLTERSSAALTPLAHQVHSTRASFLRALGQALAPLVPPPPTAMRIAVVRAAKRTMLQASAPGLLWVMFLLAGLLGLSKSFAQEQENDCLAGLLLTPASRGALYLGKMGGNALLLILLLAILLPCLTLLYALPLRPVLPALLPVLLAGVLGFSALGTLLGGLTSTLRGKEILLPLLLFPLLTPLLIAVVHLTTVVLTGGTLTGEWHWLRLLAAIDAVFLIVSYLVFQYALEA